MVNVGLIVNIRAWVEGQQNHLEVELKQVENDEINHTGSPNQAVGEHEIEQLNLPEGAFD